MHIVLLNHEHIRVIIRTMEESHHLHRARGSHCHRVAGARGALGLYEHEEVELDD